MREQPVEEREAEEREAELVRLVGSAMRRYVENMDPDLYDRLAKTHPLQYGPDSLDRIRLEFPQFFRDSKPAP
jgi:hypothetical protein